MKKRLICGVLGLVLASSMFMACNKTGNSGSEIKIGMITPVTGAVSTYGVSAKEGAELAVKEINDKGGINGKKVKLVVEDDEADQTKSVNAFNTLYDNEKVTAVLGPITSGATLAVVPNATQNKIPLLTPTATAPNVTSVGGEYTFRVCFLDSYQGVTMADFAVDDLKKKKAAVLYNVGSDYSKGVADAFKAEYEKKGGKVAQFLTYNDNDKDFNAQLTKIKGDKPDVILLPDYYNVTGLIAKQARDLGIDSTFLGVDGWESTELTKIGGDAVNGSYYVNHYFAGDKDSAVKTFVDDYKKTYSKDPDAFAALGYDGLNMLVNAIKKADSDDGEKIKDALKTIKLDGVTGKISFNNERNAVKGSSIIKVENGKTVLAKKVEAK